jgi:hypothetical protein
MAGGTSYSFVAGMVNIENCAFVRLLDVLRATRTMGLTSSFDRVVGRKSRL